MARRTVRQHIKAGTHPECATKEQFVFWAKAARHASVKYFCEDCTPQYEATMRQAGRCNKPQGAGR